MTKPIKSAAAEMVAGLEARLAEARAKLETTRMHHRRALIGMEKGVPGSDEEAETLAQGVALRKTEIEGLEGALADARLTLADLNSEVTAKAEAKERAASQARGRVVLTKSALLDKLMGELGKAYRDWEQEQASFIAAAPIGIKGTTSDYYQHKSAVTTLIKRRLGFESVLPGEAPMDRSQQPTTIEDQMRLAMGDHIPLVGRPPKSDIDREAA